MKTYLALFLSFFIIILSFSSSAQTITTVAATPVANNQFTKRSLSFIENKGQITDQYGKARRDIQFKTGSGGMSVFVGNGQLHYQFYKAEKKAVTFRPQDHLRDKKFAKPDTTPIHYDMYRLDMALEGANPHPQMITADKQTYYENYHTTALNTGNGVVSAYNKITYKNIYPHIDWVLYIKGNKLEYDFIIRSGGNVKDIKIKYNGATDIAHTDGNIKIKTPFGDISEGYLYAYEQTTGKAIAANFKLKNNTIAFSLLTTNDIRHTTMVIDPTLAWGTYYGGISRDCALATACDNRGNVFICGFTKSVSNIATSGAYQTVYNGAEDVFLSKFNSAGSLLWATYYGGESQDYANGIACDTAGNIYITGLTLSMHNIATTGSYQDTLDAFDNNGVNNGFFAKFSSAGALQWATYYNGQGKSVTCDSIGNVYFAGYTNISNHVATTSSYQDTLDGKGNAFLAKFNDIGGIIWATYFGLSTGGSSAVSCACDKEGNIFIAGDVGDTGIYATPGCYQSFDGYGNHCFIAKFDSTCHLKWSTYYRGDSSEYAYGIVCDDSLNVYITGLTNSANGISTPGAYQTTFAGGSYDAFLAKFNNTGAIQWSTYYGGSGNDETAGVVYDGSGGIYITGSTSSLANIATSGSYQDTNMGILDAFLTKFSTSGTLLYGTYYGGIYDDIAGGITSDGGGNIYFAGYTASQDHIATPGSYQNAYADSLDAFLVKFNPWSAGVTKVTPLFRSLSLYPSPNTGDFIITGEVSDPHDGSYIGIEILNMVGQVVYEDNAMLQNRQLNKRISLHNTTAGNYLMRLNIGNEHRSVKFIIQQR